MFCSSLEGMAFSVLEPYFQLIALFSLLLKIGRLEEDKQKFISFTMNIDLNFRWKKTGSDQILHFKKWMCILNTQHIYRWISETYLFNQLSMDLKLCFLLGECIAKFTFQSNCNAKFPRGVTRVSIFTDFHGFFLLFVPADKLYQHLLYVLFGQQ